MLDFVSVLEKGLNGLRVGIPKEYFGEGMEQTVRLAINGVIEQLKSDNIELVDISLPTTKYAVAVYYIIANAEASSNLARYDGVRYGVTVPRILNRYLIFITIPAARGLERRRNAGLCLAPMSFRLVIMMPTTGEL